MTNLAARNQEMKSQALSSLRAAFSKLICIPVPEDVNEVVIGLAHPRHDILEPAFWSGPHDYHVVSGGRGCSGEALAGAISDGVVESEQIRVSDAVRERMADMACVAATQGSHGPEELKKELLELFSSATVVL